MGYHCTAHGLFRVKFLTKFVFFRAVSMGYCFAVERSATDLEQCFVILDTPCDFGGNAHRGTR